MNKAKQKGTSFETMVVNHLLNEGFHHAYRPALTGAGDTGDINGLSSGANGANQVILQCKNQKAFNLSGWLDDAVSQAETKSKGMIYGNTIGAVVAKRPRVGEANIDRTYVVLQLGDFIALLNQAGYS